MRLLLLALLLISRLAMAAAGDVPGTFTVLCYHEVRKDVRDYPDPYAVDEGALVAQFAWLRGSGYTPVSLEQIVTARAGGKALPDKAVLLTFDDAYLSFYTRVFPLLREFRYPAVLAVVGKWIDDPPVAGAQYGEKGTVPTASFPTWDQVREMSASGLVEIASHSYDLHRGTIANPQGNLSPAATTRMHAAGRYEDDASWYERVRSDFQRNSERIERETGRRPRAVVWPYGSYNGELVRIAADLGMPVAMTLEDGPNTPAVSLAAMRRILVAHNPALPDFAAAMRGPQDPQPIRVVQVRLDEIDHADPTVQDQKLSLLLDRIKTLAPSHVYLQAFTDGQDTSPSAAYFPTRHLPLRADLFNRVAWQLATRAEVKVHAMIPAGLMRLPLAQLEEIHADLARHASLNGLVFMLDEASGGRETAGQVESTRRLAAQVSRWRMPLSVVRGIPADSLQSLRDDPALGKRIAELAASSDHVVVSAQSGGVDNDADGAAAAALNSLVSGVRTGPWDAGKLVVLLRNDLADPAGERIARQMRALQLNGQLNFGYGNDGFDRDSPRLKTIAPVLSLRVNPK